MDESTLDKIRYASERRMSFLREACPSSGDEEDSALDAALPDDDGEADDYDRNEDFDGDYHGPRETQHRNESLAEPCSRVAQTPDIAEGKQLHQNSSSPQGSLL